MKSRKNILSFLMIGLMLFTSCTNSQSNTSNNESVTKESSTVEDTSKLTTYETTTSTETSTYELGYYFRYYTPQEVNILGGAETDALCEVVGYDLNGNEAKDIEELIIPDKDPNGVDVYCVRGFENRKNLKKVTINSPIYEIGDYAFEYCQSLESVVFTSKNNFVTRIGNNAFLGTKIETIELGEGLKEIGDNAFSYCSYLNSIQLPESLRKLGKECFSYTGLNEITFPKYVYELNQCFKNCTKLTYVYLPSNLVSVFDFDYCSNLEKVYISDGIREIGGFFQTKITKVFIPKSIGYIPRSAFWPIDGYLNLYCEVESLPASWDQDWQYHSKEHTFWGASREDAE